MRSRLIAVLSLLAGPGSPALPGPPADRPPAAPHSRMTPAHGRPARAAERFLGRAAEDSLRGHTPDDATRGAERAASRNDERLEAYAEWRRGDMLVVDGQRVRMEPGGRFKGADEARGFSAVPLGYEVEVRGTRLPDGSLLASEVEARPNGSALFEKQVLSLTDEAERDYRRRGFFFQKARGGKVKLLGRLRETGPEVDRLRRIMDRLTPPYLPEDRVRVYVIENKEWNAMAMGNYSIYAYSGLLKELDDDELAIVLGHELAHATHEHTRRQFKKQMWIQIAALGVSAAAREIDDRNKRAVAQIFTAFAALAWRNGYGRDLEDQADRVGLRYAYEGGYDVARGPGLWRRFAKRYGEKGKVANFFFANHSLSSARAANLERELARNYRTEAAASP